MAAAKAVCSIAAAHPGAVADNAAGGEHHLEDVSTRMRDTKVGVRRAATAALLGLFRARILKGEVEGRGGVGRVQARPACSVGRQRSAEPNAARADPPVRRARRRRRRGG
jgi:hypothetical protein